MSNNVCGSCDRPISSNTTQLKCWKCNTVFHKISRCSSMNPQSVRDVIDRNFAWLCCSCTSDTFPFSKFETSELIDTFSVVIQVCQPKPSEKTKCGHYVRRVKQNVSFVHCKNCSNLFPLKCQNVTKSDFPLASNWQCNKCSLNSLPFSSISDDNLLLNLQGHSGESIEVLSNLPSFSIQSLLDQLPGQNFNSWIFGCKFPQKIP